MRREGVGSARPPVSRVLCPPVGGGGHPSEAAVARRFERPTRRRRGTRLRSAEALRRLPIWSCSGRGLPSRPVSRPLVRSYRTISPLPLWPRPARRYVSVALSVRSPCLGVTQRPVPWSPDFPQGAWWGAPRPPGGLAQSVYLAPTRTDRFECCAASDRRSDSPASTAMAAECARRPWG